LYQRLNQQNRIISNDWDLFDTRHVVFKPAKMTAETLEAGYWKAYTDFYKWGSILRGASTKAAVKETLRHIAYAGGWKKLEPLWDWVIRAKRVTSLLPMLEAVLTGFGAHPSSELRENQKPGIEPRRCLDTEAIAPVAFSQLSH
jgi:hypothetical protein